MMISEHLTKQLRYCCDRLCEYMQPAVSKCSDECICVYWDKLPIERFHWANRLIKPVILARSFERAETR